MRPISVSLVPFLFLGSPASAADGVREINQTCAVETGCFDGDSAGFPVTLDGIGGRSYRLTSDLTIANANTDGIVIGASNVTIDLNGFAIVGPVTCSGLPLACTPASGTGSGIRNASPTATNIMVEDGSIVGMGANGASLGSGARVANLRVRWNRTIGVLVSTGSTVSSCTSFENGGDGITAIQASNVFGNVAYHNGGSGIDAGLGSTISGNTAHSNGSFGILAHEGSTVSENTVYQNGNDGIEAGNGNTVVDNTSYQNGGGNPNVNGIQCFVGCLVRGNTVYQNAGHGLNLSVDSAYSDNVVSLNFGGTVTGGGSANARGGNYCAGTGTVSADCP